MRKFIVGMAALFCAASVFGQGNTYKGNFNGNGGGLTNVTAAALNGSNASGGGYAVFYSNGVAIGGFTNGAFWGNAMGLTNLGASNVVGLLTNNTLGNANTATILTGAFGNNINASGNYVTNIGNLYGNGVGLTNLSSLQTGSFQLSIADIYNLTALVNQQSQAQQSNYINDAGIFVVSPGSFNSGSGFFFGIQTTNYQTTGVIISTFTDAQGNLRTNYCPDPEAAFIGVAPLQSGGSGATANINRGGFGMFVNPEVQMCFGSFYGGYQYDYAVMTNGVIYTLHPQNSNYDGSGDNYAGSVWTLDLVHETNNFNGSRFTVNATNNITIEYDGSIVLPVAVNLYASNATEVVSNISLSTPANTAAYTFSKNTGSGFGYTDNGNALTFYANGSLVSSMYNDGGINAYDYGNRNVVGSVNAGGGLIVGASTNTASFTLVNTNWVSGQLYTNATGRPIMVCGSVVLTAGSVAGYAQMALRVNSVVTNYASVLSAVAGLTGSMTNAMTPAFVPNGSNFVWTNLSSGAGDSSGTWGGQYMVY
jgi:hypothetical protein